MLAPTLGIVEHGDRCPQGDIATRVDDYLGDLPRGSLSAVANLSQADDTWTLRLELGDTERTFRAPRCETVLDAAAFVIAATIDPSLVDDVPEADPDPDPAVPEPDSVDWTPQARRQPQPPTPPHRPVVQQPSPLSLYAAVEVGADFGALPRAGLVVRPAIGVAGRVFVVAATGVFRTRSRAVSSATPDAAPEAGGDIGLWAVGVRGCGLPPLPWARVILPLCAGVEGGQVLGRGFGFDEAHDTTLPWLAVTASPGVGFAPIPSMALVLRGEAGVAPLQGEILIDGLGVVHGVRAIFGRVVVGLEVRFGGLKSRQTRSL